MSANQPRLLIPALAPLYAALSDYAYPLIRLSVGGTVFVHGAMKIMAGPAPFIENMAKLGIEPTIFFGYFIIFLESVGALCVVLGAFTRFFATALAIETLVITFHVLLPRGFYASRGGYEMALMWAGLFIAIAIRGGGKLSIDRKIGVEL